MNILYTRTSTIQQNSERQETEKEKYDMHFGDKCSGTIPFFERPQGAKILNLLVKGEITQLTTHSLDRLGRSAHDIQGVIIKFKENKVPIFFRDMGAYSLSKDGKNNIFTDLLLTILSAIAELERNLIRERQLEGIAIAKAKGIYKGRNKGTVESLSKFLSKPKNIKAIDLLRKGYKKSEIAKIVSLHPATVAKIQRINSLNNLKYGKDKR